MVSRAHRIEPYLLANKYVDGVPYANRVINLSESGIALRNGVEPDHGDSNRIMVELVLDDSKAGLWVECERVRVADAQCEALKFVKMSVPNRLIVRKFIDTFVVEKEMDSAILNG